jgi:hypothetical protein
MLIQALGNFPGRLSVVDEFARRHVAVRRVTSLLIVVDPPFGPVPGIRHRQEPGRVRTLPPSGAH